LFFLLLTSQNDIENKEHAVLKKKYGKCITKYY